MNRHVTRLATLALAVPVVLAAATGTAAAEESVTIPGCYGGGTQNTVICDLTVTAGMPIGVETFETTVPVCAGTCQDVPVTLVRTTPGDDAAVCYEYRTGAGAQRGDCVAAADLDPVADRVVDIVVDAVENAVERVNDTVCGLPTSSC